MATHHHNKALVVVSEAAVLHANERKCGAESECDTTYNISAAFQTVSSSVSPKCFCSLMRFALMLGRSIPFACYTISSGGGQKAGAL